MCRFIFSISYPGARLTALTPSYLGLANNWRIDSKKRHLALGRVFRPIGATALTADLYFLFTQSSNIVNMGTDFLVLGQGITK